MTRFRKLGLIGLFGALGIGLIAASFGGRKPLLIWNYTASAPLGLYQVLDRNWTKGDWVAVKPEPRVAAMLVQFGVLKPGRLLIKRVMAVRGDEVCRDGSVVSINGRWAASAKTQTSRGMRLPNWGGCRRLLQSEVFLLGAADASFDGRYFGVNQSAGIVGPVGRLGF